MGELVFDVTEGASTAWSARRSSWRKPRSPRKRASSPRRRGRDRRGRFRLPGADPGMEGIAWLFNEELFDGKTWPGFFIEAAVFLLIAALAALMAYKAVKAGSPPLPEQAIEEAKLTKEMLFTKEEDK